MSSSDAQPENRDGDNREIESLRAKVREFQQIIDALPIYLFYKDDNNKIIDLNVTAAESIGKPIEEIRGRQTEEFFPETDAAKFLKDDREVIASGRAKLKINEQYETGEQGERRHIQTDKIPIRGPSGKLDRLVAIARDTTDEVRTRERAEYAEQRLSMAMNAAGVGLWDWNIQTGETYYSDTFCSMHGYGAGELGTDISTWERICHPEDVPVAYADAERHISGEATLFVNEQRIRQKDGSWHWVRAIGEVVERNDAGEAVRMLGVHVDIQEIREALERAENASRAKSEFLANMSHEIRTPMTAILGYSDLMAGDKDVAKNADELAEMAKSIQSNANHLLAVINDILDVSKIEAGYLNVDLIETNPLFLIEEVASLLRPRAKSKGIELNVRYETGVPSVIITDPTRVKQILFNVIGNAIKFTEMGSVTLGFGYDQDSRGLTLTVTDTGIGISSEQLGVLTTFEPFMQADASTSRRYGGTGLGLHISKSLARMLGGGIEIESEPGRGTTVRVSLRATMGHNASIVEPSNSNLLLSHGRAPKKAEQAVRETAGTLSGRRVLLAEDGPDNQKLIAFHLRKAGADVTIVETGTQALEMARQVKPDVILMDMQMPEMDGYEATRRLRASGCGLPIIALTAHAMDGDRERCLEAGCNEYLAKPLDKHKLIDMCRAFAESV